jgi:hypothetical protein
MNYTERLMALSEVHVLDQITVDDFVTVVLFLYQLHNSGTRLSYHCGLVWERNDCSFPLCRLIVKEEPARGKINSY